jgi:hypothetical protein
MGEEAIGDLSGHGRHARAEAAGEDGRRTEGVRARVEGRDHEGVTIELAPEVELGPALEVVEDGPDGQHDLAHAGRGPRPGLAEAVLDVGTHLRSQAQQEAAAADRLEAVGQIGEVHGAASEGDRDGRAQTQPRGVLGGEHQGKERVVLGLEAEGAVVTDLLQVRKRTARIARVLERRGGVDLQR